MTYSIYLFTQCGKMTLGLSHFWPLVLLLCLCYLAKYFADVIKVSNKFLGGRWPRWIECNHTCLKKQKSFSGGRERRQRDLKHRKNLTYCWLEDVEPQLESIRRKWVLPTTSDLGGGRCSPQMGSRLQPGGTLDAEASHVVPDSWPAETMRQ